MRNLILLDGQTDRSVAIDGSVFHDLIILEDVKQEVLVYSDYTNDLICLQVVQ